MVFQLNAQLYGKVAGDVFIPLNFEDFFRIMANIDHVRAAIGVNHDTPAGADVAHHRIAGNRIATFAKADHHAL